MWVYINSEPGLWTVGFYAPDGEWHTDSDWDDRNDARRRVILLNGGSNADGVDWYPDGMTKEEYAKLMSE